MFFYTLRERVKTLVMSSKCSAWNTLLFCYQRDAKIRVQNYKTGRWKVEIWDYKGVVVLKKNNNLMEMQ